MKYFPEIIRILENFRERRTETVDTEFRAQTESKEYQLYDGIRKGVFSDDNDAADALYGLSATDTRYSSMKNRLKVRMLSSLYHLNWRRAGFSEAAQALYSSHRGALTVHILVALGARRAGKHIADRTLRLAEKFAITDVALAMAIQLRSTAGNLARTREFEHYNDLAKQLFRNYEEELLSAEYYDRIFIVLRKYAGGRSNFASEFEGYEMKLRPLLKETSTYTFRLNYYRILIASHDASNRHSKVIEAARQCIAFLDSFPWLTQKERKGEFWLYQLNSYLGIQNLDGALKAAKECDALFNKGSNNWFGYMESYFYILMNSIRFDEANAVFTEVTTHARFSAQSDIYTEHFEVYKYYLNFALKTLPNYNPKEQSIRFNFDAMVRRADESKRDKPGMNMALRFAQVIHLFDIQDYNHLDDLMEPLQNYRTRYIKAGATEQSTLFFRLIKIMVKYSYDHKRCLRVGSKLHEQLRNETFENVDPSQEVQILPYTWLWDWMLDRMKERSSGSKR